MILKIYLFFAQKFTIASAIRFPIATANRHKRRSQEVYYKSTILYPFTLGYDHQLKKGWMLSGDIIYTKDLNAMMVRNNIQF